MSGAPVLSSRWGLFVRQHAYALFALLVAVAMVGHTLNQSWASPDFWVHLAAVRAFASSFFHPTNPLVTGRARDPYLSPYTFALGAIVRVTGARAVTVLACAGLVNLALLLFAIRRFVETVSTVEFAPLLALAFTLTAWGFNPWRWSGFFDLNSLGTVLPLSSTFASAAGLLTIVALCAWLRGGGRRNLLVVAVGAPLVLLCHPLTALWVGLVGVGFVISEARADSVRWALTLVSVVVVAGLLASLWPYYSIFRTLARSHAFDAMNKPLYHGLAERTILAVPGFVVLGRRFVRRRSDPLAVGAGLNALVYGAGYAFHRDAFGRVLPGVMLMAHVAMAIWVAERISHWKALAINMRYAIVSSVVAIVVLGGIGSSAGAIRAVPRGLLPVRYAHDARLASLVAPYSELPKLIAHNDVVVASHTLALAVAASSGKVIAPPAPAPFVDDIARRRKAVAALLSPLTPPGKFRSLVREYHVKWIVVTPREAADFEARLLDGALRLDLSTSRLRIFRVLPFQP